MSVKEEKRAFVEQFLEPMLKDTDSKIVSVVYDKTPMYAEAVTVTWDNGNAKTANVTYDSKLAIVKDVLKQIF